MNRGSAFSYQCKACGRCCRDKMITLSPYDVLRIARAAGVSTTEAVRRYTIRRGSILKFGTEGKCVALDGVRCAIHGGRPLACRLYPLGLERDGSGVERFVPLEPAPGSEGVYGKSGTVAGFLEEQGVDDYFEMNARYAALIPRLRERIRQIVDFEKIEPREFRRIAVREALAESSFDPNPLIDALFDADSGGCAHATDADTVNAHIHAIAALIDREANPAILAAAAVMLAVSLGYSPGEVIAVK